METVIERIMSVLPIRELVNFSEVSLSANKLYKKESFIVNYLSEKYGLSSKDIIFEEVIKRLYQIFKSLDKLNKDFNRDRPDNVLIMDIVFFNDDINIDSGIVLRILCDEDLYLHSSSILDEILDWKNYDFGEIGELEQNFSLDLEGRSFETKTDIYNILQRGKYFSKFLKVCEENTVYLNYDGKYILKYNILKLRSLCHHLIELINQESLKTDRNNKLNWNSLWKVFLVYLWSRYDLKNLVVK